MTKCGHAHFHTHTHFTESERLFSLLGDRKDENFLILTGSLANMEDPIQAILWFSDLYLIKKAKKSQCGN